jgi:hypothetical protein
VTYDEAGRHSSLICRSRLLRLRAIERTAGQLACVRLRQGYSPRAISSLKDAGTLTLLRNGSLRLGTTMTSAKGVKDRPCDYVGSTSGVPKIAAALLHGQSRQPWADAVEKVVLAEVGGVLEAPIIVLSGVERVRLEAPSR